MKPISLLVTATLAAASLSAQTKTPEAALGAALHQEEVQGDLTGAIASYKKLLTERGLSRKSAAQALYHLGVCYQKLGDTKSRQAFERLVSEYGDTQWASRVKLSDLRGTQSGQQTTTLLWSSPSADNEGSVSPDGRYMTYPDWRTGNLAVHDFLKHTDRAITTAGTWKQGEAAFAEESAISRDGKQVAYGWFQAKTNRFELRVAQLNGDPSPHKIFESQDMRFIAPQDWSPDGKWIAVNMEPENSDARTGQPARAGMKAAIALINSQDGSLRTLKTTDWKAPTTHCCKVLFSPDGRYLAYDRETDSANAVYVMDIESGRESSLGPAGGRNQLAAWSPNGKRILFTSNRTGSLGLWAITINDGKPQGQPDLLKPELGSSMVIGLTRGGGLYYFQAAVRDLAGIRVAGFDMSTGKLTSAPAMPPGAVSGEGGSWPAWSPDGTKLAYVSEKPLGSGSEFSIKILPIDRGEMRELHTPAGRPSNLSWSSDGRSLLMSAENASYRLNAETGQAAMLATRPQGVQENPVEHSPDGQTVYYVRNGNGQTAFLAVDTASGRTRELAHRAALGYLNLSPDGQYLATPSIDPADNARVFLLVPTNGGPVREVLRVREDSEAAALKHFTEGWMSMALWAADSKSLLIRKRSGSNVELWQAFVDGRAEQRISAQLDPILAGGKIRLSPDSRKVAFQAPRAFTAERAPSRIMVLENFLSAGR